MASVRRLKPNDSTSPWIVEYTDEAGRRRRRTPKSGLKKDADRLRVQIESEITQGVHTAHSQSITVTDAIDRFIRECEKRAQMRDGMTKATVVNYVVASNRLRPLIGRILVSDLTRQIIQGAIDALSERVAAKSVQLSLNLGRLVVDHLMREGIAKRNPFRERFRLPRGEKPLRIPSKEQLGALLIASLERGAGELKHAALIRHATICLALFSTLRRGEICGLRWCDVDLARGNISVRHSLSKYDGLKSTKTSAGVRSQVIVPQVQAALAALPGPRGPLDFVFTNSKSGRLYPAGTRGIDPDELTNTYWPPIARKAGLVRPDGSGRPLFRLHDMRHAAASLLIAQGLSILHVKEAMGHASIKTTLGVYGHLFPEDASIGHAALAIARQFESGSSITV